MKKDQVFKLIDEILDVSPGTIKGGETLKNIESWDSLAVVSFIASVNQHFGMVLKADAVNDCKTIPDLLALLGNKVEA